MARDPAHHPRLPHLPHMALLLSLVLWCGACKLRSGREVVLVSGAMSLGKVLRKAGAGFEARHPGTMVRLNLGASGVLATQIVLGAPVDVFVSASTAHMARVVESGAVARGEQHELARNSLVIVGSRVRGRRAAQPGGLATASRVAVGNPATVPAGRYARQFLVKRGLWKRIKRRVVLGEHVRQVLDYVARGEVEVGLVYRTDYLDRKRDLVLVGGVGAGSHSPIIYPVAVLKASGRKALALSFVRHLLSAPVARILRAEGFQVFPRRR